MEKNQQEKKNQGANFSSRVDARPRAARRWWPNISAAVDVLIALIVFVGIWQLVYYLHVRPSFLLPSPETVLNRFVTLTQRGILGTAVFATMWRLVIGFALAVSLGLAIGLLMVTFRRFGRMMSSFSVGLQSFPSIAWVPFAILLVGLNDYGIIFVMVISSVFSMMLSTYSGIRNIPPIYIKAAKNMGAKRLSLFANVMLPGSMPSLMTGLKQAWSFSWHALIGAEILMASVGLGAVLSNGADFARMDQIMAAMITIFFIGLIADRLIFSRLEDRVRASRGLLNQIQI